MAVWKRTLLYFRALGWAYGLFWKTSWITRLSRFILSVCLDDLVSCFTTSFISANYFLLASLLRAEFLQLISKTFSSVISLEGPWQHDSVFYSFFFFFSKLKLTQEILWNNCLKWLGDWGGKTQTNSWGSPPCFSFLVAVVWIGLASYWDMRVDLFDTGSLARWSLAMWVNADLDLLADAKWVC